MRYAFVMGAIVAMAVPGAAAAQELSPRTLLPLHVVCAEQAVQSLPSVTLTVAGSQRADGRRAMAAGDVLVIHAGTTQGVDVGQSYFTRRVQGGDRRGTSEPFRLGWEGRAGVLTSGVVTVIAADERFALARVERACRDVQVGDFLEPVAMPALPTPADGGYP
ncbi:MAG: hypothetical protein R2712_31165 [Vicinamibacterales bacterium]